MKLLPNKKRKKNLKSTIKIQKKKKTVVIKTCWELDIWAKKETRISGREHKIIIIEQNETQ